MIGCHSAYHGGIGSNIQGGIRPPGSAGSIEERLSGHGLPRSIVTCAVENVSLDFEIE